nr:uncharacterized protein LOC109190702 [Ipomoea batatas]
MESMAQVARLWCLSTSLLSSAGRPVSTSSSTTPKPYTSDFVVNLMSAYSIVMVESIEAAPTPLNSSINVESVVLADNMGTQVPLWGEVKAIFLADKFGTQRISSEGRAEIGEESIWTSFDSKKDFPVKCSDEVEEMVLSPTQTRPWSAVGAFEEPHKMATFSMLEEVAKMIRPWNKKQAKGLSKKFQFTLQPWSSTPVGEIVGFPLWKSSQAQHGFSWLYLLFSVVSEVVKILTALYSFRMENQEDGPMHEYREKILHIFSDFMARIALLEDLLSVGNRLLVGFQNGLEYVQRPPIEMKSDLVERIIRDNETKRLLSYIEEGCKNTNDEVQACHLGLQDHKAKAKCLVDELACLLDDAAALVQSANNSLPCMLDRDTNSNLNTGATSTDRIRYCSLEYFLLVGMRFNVATVFTQEEVPSCVLKPEVTDIATMMAVIFAMVKKDYVMQEKIVSSLGLKSSSGELESYCLMWSLRPFVDDEIMQRAWKLVH